MQTEPRTEDEQFDEFVRDQSRRGRVEPVGHGMTRVAADVAYFRSLPYPFTPEQEAEIERQHRNERKAKYEDHRAGLIAFGVSCLDGKHGRAAEEIARSVMQTVTVGELMDRSCDTVPENCCNLALWDIRRRVAWAAAKARGEAVQSSLKTRMDCLAIYEARKFADERFADNDGPRIPPPPDYGYSNQPARAPETEPLFGDHDAW